MYVHSRRTQIAVMDEAGHELFNENVPTDPARIAEMFVGAERDACGLRGDERMRRRGDKKAIIAVGQEILVAAHRVLSTREPYEDPGPEKLRNLSAEHVKRRALAQLQAMGDEVTVRAPAA